MKRLSAVAAYIFQFIFLFAGGGIVLILTAVNYRPEPTTGNDIYTVVVLICLIIIVLIEIVSVIKIVDSTIHTVLSSLSLLLSFIFSYDMQELLNPWNSPTFAIVAEHINFFAFFLIILSHVYAVNYIYRLGINKVTAYVTAAYSAANYILYAVLRVFDLQYIAYIATAPLIIYLAIKIYRRAYKTFEPDWAFFSITAILTAAAGSQVPFFLFTSGVCPFHIYGLESTYFLLIEMLYAGIYMSFMLKTQRKALDASEYKLQAEIMRVKMLRDQINPHFIFNSLIVVKEAYHCDAERGDLAINYFSHYLRANVGAMELDCIPFTEELDNVENYIGLENLKRAKPANIIYDVEYEDFLLPVLSLQVFVENAVRYARVDEKEDGYIAISSYEDGDTIIVEVADNGAGFDVNAVKENSCGIKNVKERFKILLNAEVEINSKPREGTVVKIIIPRGGDERQ